jgi:hypothetical protein
MPLTNEESLEIKKSLGAISQDKRIAKFYIKAVLDTDATYSKAMELADKEALEKGLKEADYKPENLKKFGAENEYKDVLYVNIRHMGSKDNKSVKATDEHKITFVKAWEAFERDHNKEGLDLRLLPKIKESQIAKLNSLGIETVEQFANSEFNRYPELKQLSINLMRLNNGETISKETKRDSDKQPNLSFDATRSKFNQAGSYRNGSNFGYSFTI